MINGFYGLYQRLNSFKKILVRMASSSDFILNFDNQSLKQLPTDVNINNEVRKVKGFCFVRVNLTSVIEPTLIITSSAALRLLGITEKEVDSPDFVEYFAGNKIMPGSEPAAHCYCGHQFGYFAGQLGDGAAIYLGEVVNESKERWEVQLKGAGLTPFSRSADGRKVLRSSIREFLCSEAMHHLGIPTTRAGTCITSKSRVWRDIFYDGNPTHEQCSIVSRIAPTFIRFGSFEIAKGADRVTGSYGPSVSQPNIIQTLTNFVIKSYYPQLWTEDAELKSKMYVKFFSEVVERTARLVAKWQCVGFCHGVLNTDNMSILGLTIDYGPYGFMDRYDPNHICNASDTGGRYTYKKQPEICRWNLVKLAEALQLFVPMSEMMEELKKFDSEYEQCYMRGMRAKLGLISEDPTDGNLIESFLNTMHMTGADFTNSFRCLSQFNHDNMNDLKELLLTECSDVQTITEAYKPQMDEETLTVLIELANRDPQMSINNRQVQHLVDTEKQKIVIYNQYKNMSESDKRKKDGDLWMEWLVKYKSRLFNEITHVQRKVLMDKNNPKFILRNHLLQEAIEDAENGDFKRVKLLLKLSENPYDDIQKEASLSNLLPGSCSQFYNRPPANMAAIKVT